MSMSSADAYVEIRKNREGKDRAYIRGTRVRVQDVASLSDHHGKSPDEIAAAIPHLTLGQIHGALAYYFDHRDAITAELREDEAFTKRLREALGPGMLGDSLTGKGPSRDSLAS